MVESRTSKSIKNAQVSLIYYFAQLILGFFSRKVFFDYLGSEILGLNTTAANLLGFLNLAELGVGMSIGYFLYQPLYENNTERLNKIIALQGWMYRHIALYIIGAACILGCFFPLIFEKVSLPLYYAYITFGTLLFSSMLGYFVNYKQIILQADQKNYKVQRITQGVIVIKTILQILVMPMVSSPFFFWTVTEIVFSIISASILTTIIKREYPWLETKRYKGRTLLKEFPDIIIKTKQVFFHKISTVILTQSTPLIMYAYSTLTMVAYYGNYQMIIGKVGYLLEMIFNSTSAGVGNLIASKDEKKIVSVFWELSDSRLCFSCIGLLSLYFVIQPFITLWLGKDYLLSENVLILLLISTLISVNRTTIYAYIGGYGLFKDIWATMTETFLNIGSSLLLGYFYGLEGVICGVIIGQLFIPCLWKPYFLFKFGIKKNALKYFFLPQLKRILFIIVDFILIRYTLQTIKVSHIKSYFEWGFFTFMLSVIIGFLIFTEFYIGTQGMRSFVIRFTTLLRDKTNHANK